MNSIKGFIYGISTAVTFGLIPLFTLPLMQEGMQYDSILFYRFLFASLALGILMKAKRIPFRIERRDIPFLILLGFFYTISSMFLFWGYSFMSAGIATTIHFTYPIFVTLILGIFFHEKVSAVTWIAIVLAISGVARLSIDGDELQFAAVGIIIVVLSAVGYASYITFVNKSRIKNMPGWKLAFYVFIVSTLLFALKAMTNQGIQPIQNGYECMNLLLLALVPTIVSNITLVQAVQNIGGTLTSILGAFEPLTAMLVGVLFFHEPFTPEYGLGIIFIVSAVTLIILSQSIVENNRPSSWKRLLYPRMIKNKILSHFRKNKRNI